MSYDHATFVHPVPNGYVIPNGTQVLRRDTYVYPRETFFTTTKDLVASPGDILYLDYDITKPKLPNKVNSLIYNVHVGASVYPLAVYQGSNIWSAFSEDGGRTSVYTPGIMSFDTPPEEETKS